MAVFVNFLPTVAINFDIFDDETDDTLQEYKRWSSNKKAITFSNLKREYVPNISNYVADTIQQMSLPDNIDDFRTYFRVSRHLLDIILEEIFAILVRKDGGQHQTVSPEKQLLVFLWYISNMSSMREVKHIFNLSKSTVHGIIKEVSSALLQLSTRSVFLPQGFPESVSEDYVSYQVWDTIQAFASSITGTLATQAVLKGVGVGDKEATVMAATMTWLLKDGTGMLGRILFAWIQGISLDCDAKRWRLFADILNDFALFLEILSPNFHGYFILIVCVSGLCKSIVGVAGGATRAALTQHQARRDNMADVSAKDASQETLVNLSGLLISLVLIPVVNERPSLIWMLFLTFTCLHLFANYSAVTSVIMETINQARLHLLVKHFIKTSQTLPIKLTNQMEPVIWKTRRKLSINLATTFSRVCQSSEIAEMLDSVYGRSQYLLWLNIKKRCINIVISRSSTLKDHFQSLFQAEILNFMCEKADQNQEPENEMLKQIYHAIKSGDIKEILYTSYRYAVVTFPAFYSGLREKNWELDRAQLCSDEWRATWEFGGIEEKKDY